MEKKYKPPRFVRKVVAYPFQMAIIDYNFSHLMFTLSRQTDYAVRIVLHLATKPPEERSSITELSRSRNLPIPFVRRIVSRLAELGILDTVRGRDGGIRLARPASELSLQDVVEAVDGPVALNICVNKKEACTFSCDCVAREVWTDASRLLENHLRATLISHLAEKASQTIPHQQERTTTWTL